MKKIECFTINKYEIAPGCLVTSMQGSCGSRCSYGSRLKKIIIFAISFFIISANCFAVDFLFRPKGFMFIPMGNGNKAADGNERYNTGGGGEIDFEIDLSTIWPNPVGLGYTIGVEGGMIVNPLQGEESGNVSFYSLGSVAGLYYFPMSRLFSRLDGGVGMFLSARNVDGSPTRSDPGLFWRLGAEAGFRFTPGFTLAANGGFRQFGTGEVLNSGVYAGLTAQFTFQAGSKIGREGVGANFEQYDAVYPAFMQLYQTNPIGTVVIRNNENAEIRDVRLYFRATGYTASEFPCGTASIIPRGRSAEMGLLADFSPDILRFTDSGRVMGELVIRYTFLGEEREAVRAVTVATHNRNEVTVDDASAFAAFISPTSPETLDFARFVAGLERSNRRTGHNQNMQYAIWLLESLRASNIKLGKTYADETEAQYPSETLLYRTGSNRDLALLFAAALEGVGISSAFIKTEEDFLVAINLDTEESGAQTLFNDKNKMLAINNEVWLPLSMSSFNEGFMACWTKGAAILNQAFKEGKHVDFVIVREAWADYPPAPLPELGRNNIRTDNALAAKEVNRFMQTYIEQEITPLIRKFGNEPGAGNSAVIQNRLGILYARAGRIPEAKAAYERAAGMGSVPAMTNRGNLALSENDYAAAEKWFKQALAKDSQNSAAKRGMERIEGR